jgi:hypothetical protein
VAVGMLESGTAYPVIGAVLGHADANTTRRYLRNLVPSSWDRARTALDDAYQENRRRQPPGKRC